LDDEVFNLFDFNLPAKEKITENTNIQAGKSVE